MMQVKDRAEFNAIANDVGGPGVPVVLEDRRMGLICHWDDDGVQIGAYRGDEHQCLRVPFSNLLKTPIGLVAGLKGAGILEA